MADETLKEFLVGLGFKIDQTSWSRFESTITKATLQANLLAEAITRMASAVVTKVAEVAEQFEQLYYQSQRTGASVQSIRAFEYAVSQLGGTISGAASALEEFGRRIKLDAGFETWVRNLGVATRDAQGHLRDLGQVQAEVTQRVTGAHDPKMANQYREFIGASDLRTWNAINNPDFWKLYNEEKASAKSAGIDGLVDGATEFEKKLREAKQRLDDMFVGGEGRLSAILLTPLKDFNEFLDSHKDSINSTIDGIVTNHISPLSEAVVRLGEDLLTAFKVSPESALGGLEKLLDDLKGIATWLDKLVVQFEKLRNGSSNWSLPQWFNFLMFGPNGDMENPDADRYEKETPAGRAFKGAKDWWKRNAPSWLGGGAQKSSAGGKYNAADVAAILKRNGATDEEATVLGAIAMVESSGNPGAHNDNPRTGDDSYGLWQINMLGGMGPERRAKYGLKSNEDLYDPDTNAQIAIAMHRAAGNYNDWSTYSDGSYKAYVDAARRGATATAKSGASPSGGPWVKSGGREYATNRDGVIQPNVSRPISGSSWSPVGSAQAGTLAWDAPSAAWAAINNALPIGANSVSNYSRTIAPVSNTTITVNGVSNPREAAAAVGSNIDRTNADIMRFIRGVAQ